MFRFGEIVEYEMLGKVVLAVIKGDNGTDSKYYVVANTRLEPTQENINKVAVMSLDEIFKMDYSGRLEHQLTTKRAFNMAIRVATVEKIEYEVILGKMTEGALMGEAKGQAAKTEKSLMKLDLLMNEFVKRDMGDEIPTLYS